MSSTHIHNTNGGESEKKKDVIDEAIERIKEKLIHLKTQNRSSESEVERKRRFQERIKTFSSMESNTTHPVIDKQEHAEKLPYNTKKCSNTVVNESSEKPAIWDKEFY